MSESLNNKELIAVGHEFAKAMTSDTRSSKSQK
ncbi:Uncharacterised protein [Enterobacter hormaechei]|nr:Uncharacterised protein [Enterobacter hormaechei]